MQHENHLVMMLTHNYTHIFLLEGKAFLNMFTHLGPSIWPITRYKLTRTLIPQKLNTEETYVSSLRDGVRFFCHFLWHLDVQDDTGDFSMTVHYKREHVRDNAHTRITIITSTDGESIIVLVSNVIKTVQFRVKLFGITSDGETNLAICKSI